MLKSFFSYIVVVAPVVCSGLCLPASGRADSLGLNTEFNYAITDGETTDKATGEKTETDFSRFAQRFNLRMLKEIYPYLFLDAGGLLEWEQRDFTVGEISQEFRNRTLRPYLELKLNNPLYRAGLGYRRLERKETGTGIAAEKSILDEYAAFLGWRPVGFPRVDLNFTRGLRYNEPRTREQTDDRFGLVTTYAYRDFNFQYLLNRDRSEQTQVDTQAPSASSETLSTSHDGRIRYSRRFLHDRLAVDAGTRLSLASAELVGRGEVQLRTPDLGSPFFLPDETTDQTVNRIEELTDSPPSVSIDTNLIPPVPVGAGLRFDLPTRIDTVFVLTSTGEEAAGPQQIENLAFAWQVLISNDDPDSLVGDITWTPWPLAAAEFDPFRNRFEIRFQPVEARLVKVVVTPPDNAQLVQPIILTGIEAYTTFTGRPGSKFDSSSQEYDLSLGYRFSPKTSARYYSRYSHRQTEPADSESSYFSHTLGVQHVINRIFSARSQFTWDESRRDGREATGYTYAASLLGRYLPTFTQTLSYSGSTTRREAGTSTTNSLLLRHVADLYAGWSAFVDLGYGWNEQANGDESTSRIMRTGTNLVPNRRMNFNIDYELSKSTRTDQPETTRQRANFRASLLPFRTLHLSAQIFVLDEKGREDDSSVSQQYSLGWNPFPDGNLQLSIGYSQSQLIDQEIEAYSAEARWRLAPRIFLTTRYTDSTAESKTEIRDVQSVAAKLNILY